MGKRRQGKGCKLFLGVLKWKIDEFWPGKSGSAHEIRLPGLSLRDDSIKHTLYLFIRTHINGAPIKKKQVEQSSDNRCVLACTCTHYWLLYLYICTVTTRIAQIIIRPTRITLCLANWLTLLWFRCLFVCWIHWNHEWRKKACFKELNDAIKWRCQIPEKWIFILSPLRILSLEKC